MQDFLLCDEIDQNLIENGEGSNAVEIKEGSNFHWGFDMKHEDILESRKKNKKKAKKEKKAKKVEDAEQSLLKNKGIDDEKLTASDEVEPQKEFILKNLKLSIRKGDFVCIIGAVGSGKSSLLSTLIGDMIYSVEPEINPYNPDAEYSSSPIMINQKIAYS
jgi:ATPase subunit of ABC transporter with duplicated ATPase domains